MDTIIDYYSKGQGKGEAEYIVPRHEKALFWLKGLKGVKNFLDVGCGSGLFLEHAKKLLPDCKLYGIELNQMYFAEARSKGFEMHSFDVTHQWPFENENFDVIHCSAVIEHLFDYKKFFTECNRCLKPGGTLIISCPNVGSLQCRIELLTGNVPVWYRNFEHIRMWTKKYLVKIIGDYGFTMKLFAGVHGQKNIIRSLLEVIAPTLSTEFVVLFVKTDNI